MDGRRSRGPRWFGRRSRLLSAVVGAVVVIMMIAGGVWHLSPRQADRQSGSYGVAEVEQLSPGFDAVATKRTGPLDEVTMAATGDEVLVVGGRAGGSRQYNGVLRYATDSGELLPMPDPPVSDALMNLSSVWTGRELIVLSVRCTWVLEPYADYPECSPGTVASLAYHPVDNAWSEIPLPPHGDEPHSASTGRALGWVNDRAVFVVGDELFGFDPERQAWEITERRPRDWANGGAACIFDDSIVGWRQLGVPFPDDESQEIAFDTGVEVARRDWSGSWELLPQPPVAAAADKGGGFRLMCSPDRLLVTSDDLSQAAVFDVTTGAWTKLAGSPAPTSIALPNDNGNWHWTFSYSVWSGREFLFWGSVLARYGWALDPYTGTWREIGVGPEGDPRGAISRGSTESPTRRRLLALMPPTPRSPDGHRCPPRKHHHPPIPSPASRQTPPSTDASLVTPASAPADSVGAIVVA